MRIGFLYGGQGSQVEKMGLDIYKNYKVAKDFYDNINLDIPLKDIAFNGGREEINQTSYTQCIIVAFQIGVTKILEENNIFPCITAGLSLGEFTSLYASRILNEDRLLELVRYRSFKMEEVSRKIDSSMVAVFTDDLAYLEYLCLSISNIDEFIQVTNINTRSQIVISGHRGKIREAERLLEEDGLKFTRLNTSGPFHTSYMNGVAKDLRDYLNKIDLGVGNIPVIHNIYGKKKKDIDIKRVLSSQVANRVYFKDTLENIRNENLDLIVEIGYGDIIKGFMKRIDRKVKVVSLNTASSIKNFLEEVSSSG